MHSPEVRTLGGKADNRDALLESFNLAPFIDCNSKLRNSSQLLAQVEQDALSIFSNGSHRRDPLDNDTPVNVKEMPAQASF